MSAKKSTPSKQKVKSKVKPTSPAAAGAPIGADRMRKQNKAAQQSHVASAASRGRKNQARRDKRG